MEDSKWLYGEAPDIPIDASGPAERAKLYPAVKRGSDIVLSLFGLLALSPLLGILALLVKTTSKGSVIFRHERIGKGGRKIKVFKFRTMVTDAADLDRYFTAEQRREFEHSYKVLDDPRVTKIGRLLRKTSLDELPQLVNILKGDMSLVGPRPIVTDELSKYGLYANIYLSVKPGLTGMWQVHGRSATTYQERILMDTQYVRCLSFSQDFRLIVLTVGAVLSRHGAC